MILLLASFFLFSDQIYVNGQFTTLSTTQPQAKVLVVRDQHIAFIGDSIPEAYKDLPQIDLKGKWVLPGLTDAHAHLLGQGNAMERIDLRGTLSFNEIINKIAAKSEKTPLGQWILGRGWDQNLWDETALPHHLRLSMKTPNHPVCLYRVDGHAAILNQKAMVLLGINPKTITPAGGQILKEKGQPTGVLIDNAMTLIQFPGLSQTETKRRLALAANYAASLGLTGIHDAGVTSSYLEALESLYKANELPIRVYAMLEQQKETLEQELPKGPRLDLYRGFLTVRCIKVYADGALGSRGAWLKEPYTDLPGHVGLQITSKDQFQDILGKAKKHGFQVATHAIGDRANRFVIDMYREALGPNLSDQRYRIEHAQILDLNDLDLFHQSGVIPSMQPTHCTSDMDWAGIRLGAKRLDGAYAWRKFLESGCYIPMGSDFPVEKVSPWDGLYSAVTRQHQDGTPVGGFFPSQNLSRLEALKGFTIWAAKASFREKTLGSLEIGKYADFTVIDRDYFSIPVMDIPHIRVLRTVIGGETVFKQL